MTDVIPIEAQLFRARRARDAALEAKEEALAAKEQAERAQKTAEEVARRAEERATTAADETSSWRMFAIDLANEHEISHYCNDNLPSEARERITEQMHELWARGQAIDDLGVQSLVNDWTGQ